MKINRNVIFLLILLLIAGCSYIKKNEVTEARYNKDTLANYLEHIKRASEFVVKIKSPDSRVSQFFDSVWEGVSGPTFAKMKIAKMEIYDWPTDAKQIGWNKMGKSIERYNALFEENRSRIVSDARYSEKLRNEIFGAELLTKDDVFGQ